MPNSSLMTSPIAILSCSLTASGVVLANDLVIEEKTEFLPDGCIPPRRNPNTVMITEGWNLIAMPVVPDKPYTVEDFIQDVEVNPYRDGTEPISTMPVDVPIHTPHHADEAPFIVTEGNWEITAFGKLDEPVHPTHKKFRKAFKQLPGNYNLVPGEAYFVQAKYTGDHVKLLGWQPELQVFIRGKVPEVPVSLNLKRGWSSVSLLIPNYIRDYPIDIYTPYPPRFELPENPTDIFELPENPTNIIEEDIITLPDYYLGYSIQRLSRELVTQQIEAEKLVLWSTFTQDWEEWELPYPPRSDYEVGPIPHQNTKSPYEHYEIAYFDFGILPNRGFFLQCKSNGLFIPGLPRKIPVDHKRVGHVGRVEGNPYFPEHYPGYDLRLFIDEDPANAIPLEGVNSEIELRLKEAASSGETLGVEGYMKVTYSTDWWGRIEKHKVLMVDTVSDNTIIASGSISMLQAITMVYPPEPARVYFETFDGRSFNLEGINSFIQNYLFQLAGQAFYPNSTVTVTIQGVITENFGIRVYKVQREHFPIMILTVNSSVRTIDEVADVLQDLLALAPLTQTVLSDGATFRFEYGIEFGTETEWEKKVSLYIQDDPDIQLVNIDFLVQAILHREL